VSVGADGSVVSKYHVNGADVTDVWFVERFVEYTVKLYIEFEDFVTVYIKELF
jgi:hypothetical protein